MKILFLIFSFNTGGIERQLIEMSNNMVRKGHSVTLCVVNHNYEETLFKKFDCKVKIVRLERPVGSHCKLAYMRKLATLVRNDNIDVIHCQEPTDVVLVSLAKIVNPHVKVIETVHDIGEAKNYSNIELRLADRFCDKYVAISKAVKDEMLQRGISEEKITVIYNAVNTDKFQFKNNKRDDNRLSNKDRSIVIGNVARFYPEKKGQFVLVKAVEKLRQKYPNIRCLFAGAVYRDQDRNWERINQYVIEHNLTQNIKFMGNVDEIPDFLSQIDIFVLPSYYEGFGISLIEAMAMGIPPVASNIDGPKEIITNNSVGKLFKVGDVNDLVSKIDYVIENYDSFDCKTISDYIRNTYGIDSMVDRHLRVYM